MLVASSRARSWSGVVAQQQELTAESLWTEVAGRLKGALNDTTFGTWFDDVESRELNDEQFVLSVPNDFTREWIEGHFLDLIGAAVRDAARREAPHPAHRRAGSRAGRARARASRSRRSRREPR